MLALGRCLPRRCRRRERLLRGLGERSLRGLGCGRCATAFKRSSRRSMKRISSVHALFACVQITTGSHRSTVPTRRRVQRRAAQQPAFQGGEAA